MIWKVYLGDVITFGDLLAKDIMYHYVICYTRYWEQFVQRPERKRKGDRELSLDAKKEENLKLIEAKVEFVTAKNSWGRVCSNARS